MEKTDATPLVLLVAVVIVAVVVLECRGVPVLARVRAVLRRLVGDAAVSPSSTSSPSTAVRDKELEAAAAAASAAEDGAASWAEDGKRGPSLLSLAPGEQSLLSSSDIRELLSHLPSRCHGRDLALLFSTSRDGYSLATLLARAKGRGPTVLVVMDDEKHVFGGFASRDWSGSDLVTGLGTAAFSSFSTTANGLAEALSPGRGARGKSGGGLAAALALTASPGVGAAAAAAASLGLTGGGAGGGGSGGGAANAAFFGSGESFLFKTRPDPFAVFRWSRRNNLFQTCGDDILGFGGGGEGYGLSLDANLERGTTGTCDTFANPRLAASDLFRVVRVEVWGFVLPASVRGGGGGGGGGVKGLLRKAGGIAAGLATTPRG
jgi:hypothetical protein